MIRALEAGGMKVCAARSPAAMHTLFLRKLVSTVVFPHELLGKYHIRIRSHLLEAKSPIAVLCWIQRKDGSIATRIVSIGPESMNKTAARENRRVASRAALLLRACGSPCSNNQAGELCETAATYFVPAALSSLPYMHRKMRLILEVIAASGEVGTSPEHIIREIWPGTERDRIHDLQSYVSKLRKSLANTTQPPIRILYRNRRYHLVREKTTEK